MKKIHQHTAIILVLLLGVVIGAAHGFHAANVNAREHFISGNELCNGKHIRESVDVDLRETIMMNYKSKISRGTTTIRLIDPEGEIRYERTDEKPILRQHSITARDDEDVGSWSFELECSRAEIFYEIDFKIKDEEE